ncbi:MAG: SufBD protein [Ruminococcaceae bacterium]|nr:SufBD protein [Oscillospiraceae bacterium]
MTNENIIAQLTSKDTMAARDFAEMILCESQFSDKWYKYFDTFASLLNHPNSYVRNRIFYIIAQNVQWDTDDKFDDIFDGFLSHITDEKPITARQCIKALGELGAHKHKYVPRIIEAFHNADLSKYKDSMLPLIKNDMYETEDLLLNHIHSHK